MVERLFYLFEIPDGFACNNKTNLVDESVGVQKMTNR